MNKLKEVGADAERAKAKAEEEALQRASEEDFEAMQANGVAAAAPRVEATKEDSDMSGTKKGRKAQAAKTKTVKPAAKAGQKKAAGPKVKAPKEDLVVFAFRLTPAERDSIHEAAGAAKASRFVRALAAAASRGDEKAVLDIVRAVKETAA